MTPAASERAVVLLYSAMGQVLALFFRTLSTSTEVLVDTGRPAAVKRLLGLGSSCRVVLRLSALFALDAFAAASWYRALQYAVHRRTTTRTHSRTSS